MANAQEHYTEAERLLAFAGGIQADETDAVADPIIARAAVHARLAEVAVLALIGFRLKWQGVPVDLRPVEAPDWQPAAGWRTEQPQENADRDHDEVGA